MAWGTDFQLQLLRDLTRSLHLGFKKTTDKLMNNFGRYNENSFSNKSVPICPFSSSFSHKFDNLEHPNITQISHLCKFNFLNRSSKLQDEYSSPPINDETNPRIGKRMETLAGTPTLDICSYDRCAIPIFPVSPN